jgi:hypothetical protein
MCQYLNKVSNTNSRHTWYHELAHQRAAVHHLRNTDLVDRGADEVACNTKMDLIETEDSFLVVCSLVYMCIGYWQTNRVLTEAVSSSETSVKMYQTTRYNIPEGSSLHTHRRENLKSDLEKTDLKILTWREHKPKGTVLCLQRLTIYF